MTDRERWREHQQGWEAERLKPALERSPERRPRFITQSGVEIDRVYTSEDLHDPANDPDRGRPRYAFSPPDGGAQAGWDEIDDLALPGEPPFTRGIHPTGHRGRLWTMRMFAGFGTAEDTNQRFKALIAGGGTGLSIAYDMPTLYGYDHDEPQAEGEFGTCGVAVSSLADMEILLDGLPVGEISTSMTINSPAPMIWAMYIAAAEKMGVPRAQLTGTLQNDILKEFIAQKEYIFPPAPSLKLVTDTVEWGTAELPRWNTISISGYHIREAGSTAVQELAFTIADGIAYVEDALARGLRFDDFAPRLLVLLQQPQRLLRGDRQVPGGAAHLVQAGARAVRGRERALHLDALPHPDRRRVADRAAAAEQPDARRHPGAGRRARRHAEPPYRCVRRGVGRPLGRGRHARPARSSRSWPRRAGVANTVDPLAGSYFVETLTNRTEQAAWAYIAQIDELGGMVRRHRGRLPAGRDRRCRLRAGARAGGPRARDWWASPATPTRTRSCASRCWRSATSRSGGTWTAWPAFVPSVTPMPTPVP